MYGMQRPKKDSQSELIKGKGTGTSDSIKKNVPAGSYIMPADSTQKLGPQNLQNLGSPQPVNLSNGEFQIAPEQVHQVGVQALEQMKNSTHTPVDQPQLGFKLGQNKPELFFANGGLVTSPYPSADDIRKAQQNKISGSQMRDVSGITRDVNRPLPQTYNSTPSTSTPSVSPASPPSAQGSGFGARALSGLGNVAKGVGVLHGVGSMVGGAVTGFNTPTEQYAERMGLDPNAERGQMADLGIRAAGVMSDVGNAASFGLLGRRFPDKQRINAENANDAQQKRFDEWNAKKNNGNGTVPNPFGDEAKPATTTNTVPVATQNTQQQDPYAIQQKGNSFSYTNPNAASQARANGIKEGEGVGFNVRSANDPKGVANFMKNTREMGPNEQQIQNAVAQQEMNLGMQGYGGFRYPTAPQRTEQQEAERQQLLSMASTPIAGARGITANQTRILSELQQGDDNRSQQRYVTDANNAANVAQTGMREAGQTGRTAMQEQGTNNRFNANLGFDAQKFQATNDLANREFNLNSAEKGFGIRNSARLEKLYEQYDTAKTDEDRKSIQEKISRYTGGKADSGKDRYMTIGGGQVYDNQAGLINQPQRLFDTQTQKFIDTPQGQNQPSEGNYKEGQVYTDASGNRAVFRNGQFQPVK